MAQSLLGAPAPAVFSFHEHQVRTVVIDDAVWFVCTDVAEALGYRNAPDASRHLDDDEKGTHILRTPGGDQKLTIISESGLYALVLRSRKPEARKFAKWVTSEVLPAIRKTGSYHRNEGQSAFNPLDGAAMTAAREVALEYFDAFRQAVKDGKPGPRMGELPAQVLEGIIADALINQRALVSFDYRSGRMACTLVPRDASVVSLACDDYVGMVERVPMARLPELADAVNQRVGMHLKSFSKRLSESNLTNPLPQR